MNTKLLERAGFTLPLPAVAYIDTIVVLFPARDIAKFRALVPALEQQESFRECKMKGFTRLPIHQPTAAILQQLADYQAHSRLIFSCVDVACDVSCDDFTSAAWVMEWLIIRCRHRWICTRTPRICHTTFYTTEKRWGGKNIAVYADRVSKITKKPCAHFELRIGGAGKVRACKIKSLQALVGLDLADFLYEQLHFEEINYEALGRVFRRRTKAKRPDIKEFRRRDGRIGCRLNHDLRTGGLHARLCGFFFLHRAKRQGKCGLKFKPNDIPAIFLREWLKKEWPGLRIDCAFERLDVREIFNIRSLKKRPMIYDICVETHFPQQSL